MSVFVCGSLHYDVVVDAPRLPRLDETVAGGAVNYVMGGKGGNQAVAAARMGASTHFAGRLGDDAPGAVLLSGLAAAGINTSRVQRDAGASGMSVAIVDHSGNYGAVIVSAANLNIDADQIELPDDATIVLLQNEIPEEINFAVARMAREAGVETVLNAAPARPINAALLTLIDVLVVNRVEAADILGVDDPVLDPQNSASSLLKLGPETVLLTLGGDGAVMADARGIAAVSAHEVAVISSHGAGDAFLGAFAAARDDGADLRQAVDFGQAAAALHVSTPIGRRGLISRRDVEQLSGTGLGS